MPAHSNYLYYSRGWGAGRGTSRRWTTPRAGGSSGAPGGAGTAGTWPPPRPPPASAWPPRTRRQTPRTPAP